MISEETPFLDLIKPENLSKIKIDKELVPSFINVMKNKQRIYDKKGYTHAKHFPSLFKNYLLEEGPNQYSIKFGKLEERVGGIIEKKNKQILISEDLNDSDVDSKIIEAVITHELFHLFSIGSKPYIKNDMGEFSEDYLIKPDLELWQGGFVNEGLTELLTRQVYPNSKAYPAQVAMVKLLLYVNNATENLYSYFNAKVPGLNYSNSLYSNFLFYAEQYHTDYSKKKYDIASASEDVFYNKAQEKLIQIFANKVEAEIEKYQFINLKDFIDRVKNFDDYVIIPSKLSKSLVEELSKKFVDVYFDKLSDKKKLKTLQKIKTLIKNERQLESGIYTSTTLETPVLDFEILGLNDKVKILAKNKLGVIVKTQEIESEGNNDYRIDYEDASIRLYTNKSKGYFHVSIFVLEKMFSGVIFTDDLIKKQNIEKLTKEVFDLYKPFKNFNNDKKDLNVLLKENFVQEIYTVSSKHHKLKKNLYLVKTKSKLKIKAIIEGKASTVQEAEIDDKSVLALDENSKKLMFKNEQGDFNFDVGKVYNASENSNMQDMAKLIYHFNSVDDRDF